MYPEIQNARMLATQYRKKWIAVLITYLIGGIIPVIVFFVGIGVAAAAAASTTSSGSSSTDATAILGIGIVAFLLMAVGGFIALVIFIVLLVFVVSSKTILMNLMYQVQKLSTSSAANNQAMMTINSSAGLYLWFWLSFFLFWIATPWIGLALIIKSSKVISDVELNIADYQKDQNIRSEERKKEEKEKKARDEAKEAEARRRDERLEMMMMGNQASNQSAKAQTSQQNESQVVLTNEQYLEFKRLKEEEARAKAQQESASKTYSVDDESPTSTVPLKPKDDE